MFRFFLCSMLVFSCLALDLFSIKGRRTGVSSKLKTGKYVPKDFPKSENITSNGTYRNETMDAETKENSTVPLAMNQTLNLNSTFGVNLNEIKNQNASSNGTTSMANSSIIQISAPFETEVVLSEVLKQRTTSNETVSVSNETLNRNETRVKQNDETLSQDTSPKVSGEKTIDFSNRDSTNEEPEKLSRKPRERSVRQLSPGQEFLLSVANLEDVKGSNLKKLPYLMNLLQMNRQISRRKSGNPEQFEWPLEMLDLMKATSGFDKADEDEDEKSTGFLAKFSADPMNFILPVIIPVSILVAAVLPLLSDQFTTGMYMPMVSTTATGDRRGRNFEDKNSTEFFVPLLESLVTLGAETFDDVTEERYDETKARFIKQAFEMVTSFVNEKWKALSNKFLKNNGSCKGKKNCTVSRTGNDDSLF
ncbi:uncharacterized protein NPIL_359821 [Nephila pilipes]|uniref:Uncharacterized protein n=1 Tax=Nephila pilipes TaxID=299642 RepID=A0A8X6Q7N2_NEPPI|nr:uncharacterized protein NPIL_359821 [Nephila pilipes]